MRKKNLFILLGAGVVFLLATAATKLNAAKRLKINFSGLKLTKPTSFFSLPDILAQFKIINPTSTSIVIDNIIGDIFINNKKISSVEQLQTMVISANAASNIELKLITPVLSAVQAIISLFTNKQKMVVRFEGIVKSGSINIPINQSVSLF